MLHETPLRLRTPADWIEKLKSINPDPKYHACLLAHEGRGEECPLMVKGERIGCAHNYELRNALRESARMLLSPEYSNELSEEDVAKITAIQQELGSIEGGIPTGTEATIKGLDGKVRREHSKIQFGSYIDENDQFHIVEDEAEIAAAHETLANREAEHTAVVDNLLTMKDFLLARLEKIK